MDKDLIKSDLYRYNGETSIYKGLKIEGFRFTYFWRKASEQKGRSLKNYLFRLILKILRYQYGFQIPIGTKIGKGLYIGHFGTIVINREAKIGINCNLSHSITIGQSNRGKYKGCPTIGNEVWIGTGSVIVGNIQIGSNVLIAPNSYVNIDVPDNSIVIGNPAKIIRNEKSTDGYINFTIAHDNN